MLKIMDRVARLMDRTIKLMDGKSASITKQELATCECFIVLLA
ncbi:hypothetical protein MHB44_16370 [Lysinibacillus sp. FSL H8-0500]